MSTSEDQPNSPRSGLGRRSFLQAALATPVLAAAPGLLTAGTAEAAPVATTGRFSSFDPKSPRFALAVLPDTQYLFDADSTNPAPLAATFSALLRYRQLANVAFLTHLGDITEHGATEEIAQADKTFRAIDGKLPYSVLAGNHDVRSDDQRGDTPYLRAFGPQRFAGAPTFGGASPDGYNSFHLFTAAGRQWLVLALDWRLSAAGRTWVQGVLDAHRTLPTILTTHELAGADDAGVASLSEYGQQLWDTVIRGNDQIFLTLNGHYWPPGRTVLTNDAGHDVHVHITNYQDRFYGGGGMVRLYFVDLARGVIDVTTQSPWFLSRDAEARNELEAETLELTSDVDRFSLEIDFEKRFAGFDGVSEPAPRPASAVVTRDTVAYWRFDGAGTTKGPSGSVVPAGTVVRDLTGTGNDLTVSLLHGSAPEVLTFSDDHQEGQPAHASLRFDGGTGPDRGAVLQTGPRAPVNSVKLEKGYTIEAYVKLPEPFVGNHAFMGILSWEGRNSEAGKTHGYSPDEPTCSLNLSSERFLQYVVYPSRQDASPTSWSHALATGRWWHLAIINNGKTTTVYVDGSAIVRNPSAPSTGIATVGKPFALGGTQFAEQFGQGFYGWIGDVRISSRALRLSELLTPYPNPRP